MANRDESHLFSLAALTTRAPVPPPRSPSSPDDEGSVAFDTAPPEHGPSRLGAGFSLFPLGAPLGNHEPLAPSTVATALPTPQTLPGRTLALVALASLLGAGIVLAALWSSRSPEPPASLARPEVLTQTLVPPARVPPAPLAPPPEPAAATPSPVTERTSALEDQPGASTPKPTPRTRPRTNSRGNPATTRPPAARAPSSPTPAPARGPCARCAPNDLACNIKCRAK